jgi:hypothetical protein
MPYGIAKSAGGDTPAIDAKMERCVSSLQKAGHSKVSAIKICKSAIQRSARKGK